MSLNVDVVSTVLLGFISAFIGYLVGFLFSIWNNRLRPWITLTKFSRSLDTSDQIEIDKQVHLNSIKLWDKDLHLPIGKVPLSKISQVHHDLKFYLKNHKENNPHIENVLNLLRKASTKNDVHACIINLFINNSFIKNVLDTLILCREISVPDFDKNDTEVLKVWYNDKEGGSFMIPHKTGSVSYGTDLNNDPIRMELTKPFIELISRLDAKGLTAVIEALHKWMNSNETNVKLLYPDIERIRDANSRWRAEVSITNFGRTPFIVFPKEALIQVTGEHVNLLPLRSSLYEIVEEKDDEGKIETYFPPIVGVKVIKSESTTNFTIITNEIQKEIPDGDILNTYYKNGSKKAHIEITAIGRLFNRKKKICSTELQFSGD